MVSSILKKHFLRVFFVISILVFLGGIFSYLYSLSDLHKANYFENLAQKAPPGSVAAKRLQTIADMLKSGEKTYQYSSGQFPSLK